MTSNDFYNQFLLSQEDSEQVAMYLQRYNEKAMSLKDYLIAFTPRSGSSWLTELLYSTRRLGNPEEWFNHYFLLENLKTYKCSNVYDYVRCLKADQASVNGYCGFEATFFQLELVLQGCSFEDLFNSPKVIYLTRNNFVSQGISLYKAVETGYFHSTQGKHQNLQLSYDEEKIKYWIRHILYQEYFWEKFFTTKNLSPLRVSYEDLVSHTASILERIFIYLNVPYEQISLPENAKNFKIADGTNQSFSRLFHQQSADFVAACKAYRSKPEILSV